jgi:hypothetical protein
VCQSGDCRGGRLLYCHPCELGLNVRQLAGPCFVQPFVSFVQVDLGTRRTLSGNYAYVALDLGMNSDIDLISKTGNIDLRNVLIVRDSGYRH